MHLFRPTVRAGLLFALSLLLSHCGGITTLGPRKKPAADLYSTQFLNKIQRIKYLYSLGKLPQALIQLQSLSKTPLAPTERALQNNLSGVILFSQKSYPRSIKHFQQALKTSELDWSLTARIKLNLGSAYYKTQKFILAYSTLKTTDDRQLNGLEKIKYFRLFFILARN